MGLNRVAKLERSAPQSCMACLRGKLRCDGQKPICSACIRNRIPAHLCVYEASISFLNGRLRSIREEINFSLVDGVGDMSRIPLSTVDLSEFVYTKANKESRLFFGPTCHKSLFKFNVDKFPIMVQLIDKSCEEIEKMSTAVCRNTSVIAPTSLDDQIAGLPKMLPNFSSCVEFIHEFLLKNYLFSQCFDAKSTMEYFHSALEKDAFLDSIKLKKGFSHVHLSIIISIIVISSFSNANIKVDKCILAATAKALIFSSPDMRSSIPTLLALILLYELRKYDFNIDFEESVSHDQALFSNIVVFAISSGLNRDIDQIHGKGDVNYTNSVKSMWRYTIFEDTLRSFQKGQQPLIRDDYIDTHMFYDQWSDFCTKIAVLRKINDRVNLCKNNKFVDIDTAIDEVHDLVRKLFELRLTSTLEDRYLELIVMTYVHCLSHIRCMLQPNKFTRDECFKFSFLLYQASKSLILTFYNGEAEKPTMMYTPYFHEIKEAVFRSTIVLILGVLELLDTYKASGRTTKCDKKTTVTLETVEALFNEEFESRSKKFNDIFWLLNIITEDIQPIIWKISSVSIAGKTVFIFVNNILSYVMNDLETLSTSTTNSVISERPEYELETYLPYYDISQLTRDDIWEFFL